MDLRCEKCSTKFTQKSSLIRHSKKCMQPRPPTIRQKSCSECSASKTRCDLKRPICSRCRLRNATCQYVGSSEHNGSEDGSETNRSYQIEESESIGYSGAQSNVGLQDRPSSVKDTFQFSPPTTMSPGLSTLFDQTHDSLDRALDSSLGLFSDLGCDSSLDIIMGSGSAHNSLSALPAPTPATTPLLAHHSMELILRILRTWPRMIAKGIQLPPIIHSTQAPDTLKVPLLSNCFTVINMWYGQCPGATDMVQATVKKEMQHIIDTYQTFNETDLLGALQALAMYLLMLLFPSNDQTSLPLLDEGMFKQVKQIVFHVASSGLILQEETDHARPSWESWIHITAKRRAVLTLYLIHWSYSVYHCLPSFDCKDLGFIPASSAKYLWQATERNKWESLYNRWLAQWDGADYYQWEMAEIQPGMRIDSRAEMWLEDADEFGMLFMSIVNAVEREPEFEIIHL